MSSSSEHLIQVNGFWVDLETVESTLILALSSHSLLSVKLVSYSTGARLALFYTSLTRTEELSVLKASRDVLLTCPSFPETLATLITFAQQLPQMPTFANGEIDIAALRSISEERYDKRRSARKSRSPGPESLGLPASPPAAGRAVSMPPMAISAFSSNTPVVPIINVFSPEDPYTPATETRQSLTPSYAPSYAAVHSYPPPAARTSVMEISHKSRIAVEIASHVSTLLSLPASASVPTYLPLKLAGLNSITTAQLYFWLQERYEYDDDISRLFEDDVSAEVIAAHLSGSSVDDSTTVNESRMSTTSFVSDVSRYSEPIEMKTFDDVDIETGISKRVVEQKPAVYKVNPNPVSYVTMSWLTNLMWKGNKKPLVQEQLYDMNHNDESQTVDAYTKQFWQEYESWNRDPKTTPRLWGSMMASTRKYVYSSALLWFLYIAFATFAPLLIQQLIVVVNVPEKPTDPAGAAIWTNAIKGMTGGIPLFVHNIYILAAALWACKVGQTVAGRTADQLIRRVALNIKTALINAVYRKSLRIGVQGIGRYEKGKILNLINVDAENVSKAIELGNLTWSIPFQVGMIVYLLSRVLGVSVWAGVGVLVGAVTALILVVPIFFRISAPMFMRFGDKRMKTIKEIMEGMTLIKVRGWESLFLQRLESIRQTQLTYLRTFNIGVAVFVIVGQLANTLVPIAALSLFGDQVKIVTSSRIFPAISFFSMLVEPLISLPQVLSAVTIALTSWGRIASFLVAEESVAVSANVNASADPLRIVDGNFQWTQQSEGETKTGEKTKTFIHDVNLSIKKGSLTAIVGNVGSGKSSMLSAMLGEMECVSGQVFSSGTFAYCPQQAWIESSTVQENITFGKPMDTRRMKRAIGAASFASDLERLPNGIASAIAERGANLSGGQKARLSLARAVYADADNVLLDDPLAALDPRVGRTVFDECIRGALAGKTRVLVTQALHFLPQVDHVIVINDGTVVEQGSYAQLYRQHGQLRKMIDSMEKQEKKADEEKKVAAKTGAVAEKKEAKVEEDAPSGPLVAAEAVTTGAISGATWWAYAKAAGGWYLILALCLAVVSQQAGTVMMNQWLSWWTSNEFQQKIEFWFGIYDGIGFGVAALMICVNVCILLGSLNASRSFHNRAFSGVIAAPMSWFHANPAGRVLNRFGADIGSIDQRLMPQVVQCVAGFGSLLSIIAIITRSAPVILAIIGPLLIIYFFLLRFYRRTLRELKRLESRSRSPLQSKVNETLDGIPTLAAFGRCMEFAGSATTHNLIDESNKPVYLRTEAEIWVTLRMEFLSAFVVLAVAILGNQSKVMNIHQFGSALSYANAMTYVLGLLVKSSAAIESEMSSVERLQEYADKLPKDAATHLETDPAEGSWPSRGEIIFKDVTAAYPSRPEKPVLRDVNIRITPGTTTFIVGRTGSGKSTMLSVLLRLLEIGSGSVIVDGEDITKLGVHTLRRGMELIPQDPFIFSGTIRTALDFEGRYDDTSLWHALELVGLKDFISGQEDKLDSTVAANGANFSVGQRQLLCLAGAILRNPKILLLDEATASVDAGSDAFLQKTMRQNCPGATILSVMHRLSDQVLRECDKVLVMDNGVPAEYDTPKALLSNPDSLFSQIMEATKH